MHGERNILFREKEMYEKDEGGEREKET